MRFMQGRRKVFKSTGANTATIIICIRYGSKFSITNAPSRLNILIIRGNLKDFSLVWSSKFLFWLNLVKVVKIEGCNCTRCTRPYAAPYVKMTFSWFEKWDSHHTLTGLPKKAWIFKIMDCKAVLEPWPWPMENWKFLERFWR